MGLFSNPEPEECMMAGKPLRCLICSHNLFFHREALLNTSGMSFFNLDWANRSGTCFVCSKCGYIHWFLLE